MPMACLFRVLSGPYRGKVFPVDAIRPLLIGRALEADFCIPDGGIEAFHCRVEFESGQTGRMAKVIALDAHPEKQLEVDGVPFSDALLKSGDRVRLGETTLEFREGGGTDDPPGGEKAEPGRTCVACKREVPEHGGGRILLGAPYCCRCIDLRLIVKRELGRYRILRKIGRDVAELIYAAEDLRSEPPEKVALHVLKSERMREQRVLRRFLTKGAFGFGLDHPLFPLTRDLVNKPDVVSFVEEFVDWPSLTERADAGRNFPLHQAAKIAGQLVEGLKFARRKGMVVGKLRGPRIYVADSGAVRIRDYWLTPEAEDLVAQKVGAPVVAPLPDPSAPGEAGDEDLTLPQAGGGGDAAISADMRRYLAPAASDLAHYKDETLDVRPVGCVFVQLATGSSPGEIPVEDVLERVRKAFYVGRRPQSPSNPPAELTRVLTRSLDRNPAARYRTLVDLGKELKSLVPLL